MTPSVAAPGVTHPSDATDIYCDDDDNDDDDDDDNNNKIKMCPERRSPNILSETDPGPQCY